MQNLANLLQSETNPDFGIYNWTQAAFDKFHQIYHAAVPERFHNLPFEVALAGFTGAYALTRALQWTSRNVVDKYIWPQMINLVKEKYPSFDNDILPKLERACEVGIPAAFLLYAIVNPEAIERKPVDNWGVLWAQFAGILAAEQDFARRRAQQTAPKKN